MNIRSKKFSIVLLTLIFTVSVFAVTAFAEGESAAITPESQITEPASSKAAPPSSAVVETSSAPTDESRASAPEEETSSNSSSRTSASSHKETASSKYRAPVASFDTQAHRVEATASEAAQAVSDPDILSSENWSELLSSGDSTQNQNAAAGTASISSTASAAGVGGVSWILILGVVLIVLALCGFGLFVFLQFFSNNRGGRNGRGGRGGSSANAADENSEKPLIFTDIRSASDGKQHRSDYVPNDATDEFVDIRSSSSAAPVKPAAKPRTVKKAPVKDAEVTAPIPQIPLPDRKPAMPAQGSEPLSKSQATPVSSNSNFDWEKFFNDQE